MEITWGRVWAGVCVEEIEIQTLRCRCGGEYRLDHDAGLEDSLDVTGQITSPILQRLVGQAQRVHRQNHEKAIPVTGATAEHKGRTGCDPISIPRALQRFLPKASVVEVDAIHRRIETFAG